jgi:hypothetical protein
VEGRNPIVAGGQGHVSRESRWDSVVRGPAALSWHDLLVDVALDEQPLGAPVAAGLLDAFAAEVGELYPG